MSDSIAVAFEFTLEPAPKQLAGSASRLFAHRARRAYADAATPTLEPRECVLAITKKPGSTLDRMLLGLGRRSAVGHYEKSGTMNAGSGGYIMDLKLEFEQEEDGRWLAEVIGLPGVLAYGATVDEAMLKAESLALRAIAERLDHGESRPVPVNISFDVA